MKAPFFKPVAKAHDLMELNKQLHKSLQTNLNGDAPDWEAAGHEARLLGEIANVLQYHRPTSDDTWWRFAATIGDGTWALYSA